MQLDVIIVNWNAGKQLLECVASIIQNGQSLVRQIIVVDNGSTDGSENAVRDIPGVRLILAGENLGFAKACNLGAKYVLSDYLLFLNPDTALYEDTLSVALQFMERPENADLGICGIRLVDENGTTSTSAARFPTIYVMTGTILGLAKLFPCVFPAHLMAPSELSESKPVDQVIGAFFLIRKHVFDCCQGFDEQFFVYFEEVDLSLRAKMLGYTSYYLANVSAFHRGGGCSEQVKATRLFYSLRSRVLYARKHYDVISYMLLIVLTVVELPLRLIRSAIRRSWSEAQNTLTAYRLLFGHFFGGTDGNTR